MNSSKEPPSSNPARPRRWFLFARGQFSLRGLLLLLCFVALALAMFVPRFREWQAWTALEKAGFQSRLGGEPQRDEEDWKNMLIYEDTTPSFLKSKSGPGFLATVREARVWWFSSNMEVNVSHLVALNGLQTLGQPLSRQSVATAYPTGSGPVKLPTLPTSIVQKVGEIQSLESLDFGEFLEGTDANLKALSNLTQLRTLTLHVDDLKPQALAHLGRLTKLRELDLVIANSADVDLSFVADLPELTSLKVDVREPSLSRPDAVLQGLGLAKSLETLKLSAACLDDSNLEEIGPLPQLKTLVLIGSFDGNQKHWPSLSARGFRALARLPKLQSLVLQGIDFPASAVAELRAAPALTCLALLWNVPTREWVALHELQQLTDLSLTRNDTVELWQDVNADLARGLQRAMPRLQRLEIKSTRGRFFWPWHPDDNPPSCAWDVW